MITQGKKMQDQIKSDGCTSSSYYPSVYIAQLQNTSLQCARPQNQCSEAAAEEGEEEREERGAGGGEERREGIIIQNNYFLKSYIRCKL